MTCQDFEPFLFAYVDGEFDGPREGRRRRPPRRLRGLPPRGGGAEGLQAQDAPVGASSSALSPPAPAALRARIEASLEKERAPVSLSRTCGPPTSSREPRRRRTVATVVWLSGASSEQANRLIQRPSPPPAGAAARRPGPDEQAQHVRDWLRGRVDFAPSRIPELRNVRLQAPASRSSTATPRLRGLRPAWRLRDPARRVSLCLRRPEPAPALGPPHRRPRRAARQPARVQRGGVEGPRDRLLAGERPRRGDLVELLEPLPKQQAAAAASAPPSGRWARPSARSQAAQRGASRRARL
jgi:hypothetical protein